MTPVAVKQEELTEYEQGYLDALWQYAWMKDGTSYVGTTGRLYSEAVRTFLQERNPKALA